MRPFKEEVDGVFSDEELYVTAVTPEIETETVLEWAGMNAKAIGSMIYDGCDSLRRRRQTMEMDAAGKLWFFFCLSASSPFFPLFLSVKCIYTWGAFIQNAQNLFKSPACAQVFTQDLKSD